MNKDYCLSSATSSRASVLSTNSDSPPVTKTTVSSDLLKTLDIITKLSINVLGKDLVVLSCLEILLSVQEPKRNLELAGVLDDGNKLFNLIGSKFSGSLVNIDLGLFADEISESASKTLNFRQTEHNISLSLNVSVQNTKNVLKFSSLHQRRRHGGLLFLQRQCNAIESK
mmetsp:Transcript_46774/g.134738  ORF Transcript_46774/g.134738 Transcript_46774/m.134738 type:complete len:170 (-) Transcript_46774:10-519(-)